MSDIFLKPAPSCSRESRLTSESRNVFAWLAKGSQEPRPCLWNFRLLSRSGGLLLEKLTHSFQIEASKHRPVCSLFLPEGGLLVPPPVNSASQPGGKAVLGNLFSGAVSTDLEPSPETHMHTGKQTHMNKTLISRRALVKLTVRNVLGSYGDTSVCEAA